MDQEIAKVLNRFDDGMSAMTKVAVNSHLCDYILTKTILEKPSFFPRQYVDAVRSELGRPPQFRVLDELSNNQLDSPEKRESWSARIHEIGAHLQRFYDLAPGASGASDLYGQIKKEALDGSRFQAPMHFKAVLIVWLTKMRRGANCRSQLEHIVKKSDSMRCQALLRELLDVMAVSHNLQKSKTVKEKLNDTRDLLKTKQYSKSAEVAEVKDADSRIYTLQKENEDLLTALEFSAQQLEQLVEEIDKIRGEASIEASVSFYQRMNAPSSGNLLDQFAWTEERLRELRESGFTIPEQIESVPLLIRMFMKFVRSCGLKSLDRVGAEYDFTLSQTDTFDYTGQEYASPDEVKNVIVATPGWVYDGVVITRPKLQEVRSERGGACHELGE